MPTHKPAGIRGEVICIPQKHKPNGQRKWINKVQIHNTMQYQVTKTGEVLTRATAWTSLEKLPSKEGRQQERPLTQCNEDDAHTRGQGGQQECGNSGMGNDCQQNLGRNGRTILEPDSGHACGTLNEGNTQTGTVRAVPAVAMQASS